MAGSIVGRVVAQRGRTVRIPLAEVRRLREELDSLREDYDVALDHLDLARERARLREREAAREARRQAEEEYYRWEAQERALRDLEHARRWGDPWAEERALRRLRDAW